MTGKDELLFALSDIDQKYVRCVAPMLRKRPVSTWRYVMKRSVKLAISTAVVILLIAGFCLPQLLQNGPRTNTPPAQAVDSSSQIAESGEPLRLCVDLHLGFSFTPSDGYESAVKRFLSTVAEKGGPENVTVEVIPDEGAERESALTRIRTEIMSGGGPDVFICNCPAPEQDEEPALFPFPEKAMSGGTFLPLDDLIEKAQFTEWEKLTPAVMDAGKNESGQVLLPLVYSLPMTFFRSSDVKPYPADTAWAQVAAGDDPVLAASMDPLLSSLLFYSFGGESYFSYTWKDIADYSDEKLLVSEEQVLQRAKEAISLLHGEHDTPLPHFRGVMDRRMFDPDVTLDPQTKELRQGIYPSDPVTMVPLYCDQGGAVAAIRAFAGINANTERPEDAFFILDVLLSRETQEHSELYTDIWGTGAWPVYEGIDFNLREETLAAFQETRSQISGARFHTSLDTKLGSILSQYELPDAALSEIVADTYREMQTLLAES